MLLDMMSGVLSDILRCTQAHLLMGGDHRVESFENKQVSGQTSSVFNPESELLWHGRSSN